MTEQSTYNRPSRGHDLSWFRSRSQAADQFGREADAALDAAMARCAPDGLEGAIRLARAAMGWMEPRHLRRVASRSGVPLAQLSDHLRRLGPDPHTALPIPLPPHATASGHVPPAGVPVVYCLMADGRVVYVGSTSGAARRLGDHAREKRDLVDAVIIIPTRDRTEMLSLEADLIFQHKPPLNTQGVSSRIMVSL